MPRAASDGNKPGQIIKDLFMHRDAIEAHLAAPLLAEREAYIGRLLDLGRAPRAASEAASLVRYLACVYGACENGQIDDDAIGGMAQAWVNRRGVAIPRTSDRRGRNFRAVAREWFRLLKVYKQRTTPFFLEQHFVAFVEAMPEQFGYRSSTVEANASPTRRFLIWVSDRCEGIEAIRLTDVDAYIAERRSFGCKYRTIVALCRALRTFFRYAEQMGWNCSNLSKLIKAPCSRAPALRADCPSWQQVRHLIESLDDSKPSECRAKAILLLASIYGMRRAEIVRLTLDDLDWENEVITIRRAKRGRAQQFPLQHETGEAIIRYLQSVRPRCLTRHLFVTLKTPYRPALHLGSAIGKMISESRLMKRRYGLHTLRHACATELLRKGTSLQGIADFLGHRDLRSVSIYAQCDTRALRRVSCFSLEAVL